MNKKQLYYKIRAFQQGKPNPVKFNCRAENPTIALEKFAILTLVAGTKFDRFTIQAS